MAATRRSEQERRLVETIAKGFAPAIKDAIAAATDPLMSRIAELERLVGTQHRTAGEVVHKRAFCRASIKAVASVGQGREITGLASTPKVDRQGDIVEPQGAMFTLPIPLLLDHRHDLAVGEVTSLEVRPDGIRFKARISTIDTPGEAKELTDRAWDYVKHGLRRTVSIGFRPLESKPHEGGGWRFAKWELLELSLVAIPANADARLDAMGNAA